jgi:adenine deaminase
VAPGYRADLVVLADAREFRPSLVLKNGRAAARDGAYLADTASPHIEHANTIHIAPLDAAQFELRPSRDSAPVIRIVPDQLITRREETKVRIEAGVWTFDPERDVAVVASIERHRASGCMGLGLVSGFGLRRHGALGSSVAHDSHNLIVVGTNPRDMLACAHALREMGGGFVAASDGAIQAALPLALAGLISMESADTVCRKLEEVNASAHALGCPLDAPFGALSFLALPVIPELRITDRGLYDVVAQKFVKV